MFGKAGDADSLIVLLGLSQNLNEDRDAAAVYVGFLLKLDENFRDVSLLVELPVRFIDIGFGMGGDIALDVYQRNVVLPLPEGPMIAT